MTLATGVREALADMGELEDIGWLKAFALEALVENFGALKATWVGGLAKSITGIVLLSFLTFNALW